MASIARASQTALKSLSRLWSHAEDEEQERNTSKRLSLATTLGDAEQTQPLTWSSTLRSLTAFFNYEEQDCHEGSDVRKTKRSPRKSPKRSSLKTMPWNTDGMDSVRNEQCSQNDSLPPSPDRHLKASSAMRVLPLRNRVRMRKSLDRLHAKISETFTPSFNVNLTPSASRKHGSDSEPFNESPPAVGMGLREEFDRSRAEREQRYREILGRSPPSTNLDGSLPGLVHPLQPRKSIAQDESIHEDSNSKRTPEVSFLHYATNPASNSGIKLEDAQHSHAKMEQADSRVPVAMLADTEWDARPSFEHTGPSELLKHEGRMSSDTHSPKFGLTYDKLLSCYCYRSADAIDATEIAWLSSDDSDASLNETPLSETFLKAAETVVEDEQGLARGRSPKRASHHPRGSSSSFRRLPFRMKRYFSGANPHQRLQRTEVQNRVPSIEDNEALIEKIIGGLSTAIDEGRSSLSPLPLPEDQSRKTCLHEAADLNTRHVGPRTPSTGHPIRQSVPKHSQDHHAGKPLEKTFWDHGTQPIERRKKIDLPDRISSIPGLIYMGSLDDHQEEKTPSRATGHASVHATKLPRPITDPGGLNRSTHTIVRYQRKSVIACSDGSSGRDDEEMGHGDLSGTETSSEFEMYPLD